MRTTFTDFKWMVNLQISLEITLLSLSLFVFLQSLLPWSRVKCLNWPTSYFTTLKEQLEPRHTPPLFSSSLSLSLSLQLSTALLYTWPFTLPPPPPPQTNCSPSLSLSLWSCSPHCCPRWMYMTKWLTCVFLSLSHFCRRFTTWVLLTVRSVMMHFYGKRTDDEKTIKVLFQ